MINHQIKAEGTLHFELIDRRGRVLQSGETKNLILNSGLNYLMTGTLNALCSSIAVGTSSAAPEATQTLLGAEVGRTDQALGLITGTKLTKTGAGTYRRRFGVAFDYNRGNGNLTEFGGSSSSSANAVLTTRSLFRNANGDPIVITKTADTRLVLYYDVDVTMGPTVPTAGTVDIAGLGVLPVTYMCVSRNDDYGQFGDIHLIAPDYPIQLGFYTSAPNMTYLSADNCPTEVYGNAEAYTSGTFARRISGERPPEAQDVTIYGYGAVAWAGNYNSNTRALFKVRFDTPIVKSKDYKLKAAMSYSVSR